MDCSERQEIVIVSRVDLVREMVRARARKIYTGEYRQVNFQHARVMACCLGVPGPTLVSCDSTR